MERTPREEMIHFLSDMDAVEQQALAQLVSAPDIAGHPDLAIMLRHHHAETEEQARLVRQRLEALGSSPSAVKNTIMRAGGKAFLLFARVQPETPGKLTAHAYAYEAMEWAGYEMLLHLAEEVGDTETADLARRIGAQERTMMERLEHGFDAAEEACHGRTLPASMGEHIRTHLADAHALESQGRQLLRRSERIAGGDELASIYRDWLEESREHANLIENRLATLGADVSRTKDAALALGGINWSLFFQAQSDTPVKLAAFVYAFEHLKIAGYELLKRSARRAGDTVTEAMCRKTLARERAMAERLTDAFPGAVAVTTPSA